MALACCSFIPPYILYDIAAGQNAEASRLAKEALAATQHIHKTRKGYYEARHGHAGLHGASPAHQIVPDYILEDLINAEGVDETTTQYATQTLAANRQFREQRLAEAKDTTAFPAALGSVAKATRSVYTMEGLSKSSDKKNDKGVFPDITYTLLPGKLVRGEGQVAVSDKTVNQVYDNTLQVLQFFQTVFQYNSLNGQNMPVVSSVHAKWNLLNASWYGVDTTETPNVTYNQMVYGDGLPGILLGFANCLDVIGHEMMVNKPFATDIEQDSALTPLACYHAIQ
jgi:Zn-dependent metalloprotease